jgi:hypothetical protein
VKEKVGNEKQNEIERYIPTCRLLHASSVLPSQVDIYIDHRKWISSLAFSQITLPFKVPTKPFTIIITRSMHPEHIIWQTTVNLKEIGCFTLALTEKNSCPHLSVYIDDPVPITGRAKLRMVQLAPDTSPISISTEQVVLFSDVWFGDARFLTLPSCQSPLFLRLANTDHMIYRVPTLHFKQGRVYTIFMVGRRKKAPKFRLLLL